MKMFEKIPNVKNYNTILFLFIYKANIAPIFDIENFEIRANHFWAFIETHEGKVV